MKMSDIPQLRDAPLSEKLELVEEIWAEITRKGESLPVPDWHAAELERSLAEYQANPREGSPWSEVRTRILNRKSSRE